MERIWGNRDSLQMSRKIKEMDGVSEEDVGLELHVKDRGDRKSAHAHEEITDDDVFKELINIVMDVFSTKSEKCMLTFELPEESEFSNEISPEQPVRHRSDMSSNSSNSDTLIPKDSMICRKSFKKKLRKFKVPTAKRSKYYKKKKSKNRLHPIVQTALHPRAGRTDLKRFFWLCGTKHGNSERQHSDQRESLTDFSNNMANGWKDIAEKDPLHEEASTVRDKNTPFEEHSGSKDKLSCVYDRFKEVSEAFGQLAQSLERTTERMSFGELSYHLEEIHHHIGAIGILLQDSNSSLGSDIQIASKESSEFPKINNKMGTKVIRIGAKISQKSSMQAATLKRWSKNRNHKQKVRKTRNEQLNEILKNYQRVKKEETEIFQNLLQKLGFKDNSNYKRRRRHSNIPKEELLEKTEIYQNCDSTQGKIQLRLFAQHNYSMDVQKDSMEETIPEPLKEPQNNKNSNAKAEQLMQISLIEHKTDRKQKRNRVNNKAETQKSRKSREHIKKSREISFKGSVDFEEIMNAHLTKYPPRIRNERLLPLIEGTHHSSLRKFKRSEKRSVPNFMKTKSRPSTINTVEKMMHRIRNAAERLEHAQNLVEKKLNVLSKQQKALNKKVKRKNSEECHKERGSNGESQSDDYKRFDGSLFKSSTEIEELISQPYTGVSSEGSENSMKKSGSLSAYELQNFKEAKDGKPNENCESKPVTRGTLNEEKGLGEINENYICNFVMELREKESELTSLGSMDSQRGSEQSDKEKTFPAVVLTNEFKENASSNDKDLSASSPVPVTTKENESEIIEESLFANPFPNHDVLKTTGSKKKRVIHAPLCTVS